MVRSVDHLTLFRGSKQQLIALIEVCALTRLHVHADMQSSSEPLAALGCIFIHQLLACSEVIWPRTDDMPYWQAAVELQLLLPLASTQCYVTHPLSRLSGGKEPCGGATACPVLA